MSDWEIRGHNVGEYAISCLREFVSDIRAAYELRLSNTTLVIAAERNMWFQSVEYVKALLIREFSPCIVYVHWDGLLGYPTNNEEKKEFFVSAKKLLLEQRVRWDDLCVHKKYMVSDLKEQFKRIKVRGTRSDVNPDANPSFGTKNWTWDAKGTSGKQNDDALITFFQGLTLMERVLIGESPIPSDVTKFPQRRSSMQKKYTGKRK